MGLTYYKPNLAACTFGELRGISKNGLEFLLLSIFKIFRVQLPTAMGVGFLENEVLRVTLESLSPTFRGLLEPGIELAKSLGAQPGIIYSAPLIGTTEAVGALLPSANGEYVVTLIATHSVNANVVVKQLKYGVTSRMKDGRWLTTTGARPELSNPPEYIVERHIGWQLADLIDRHRERLSFETGSYELVRTEDDLERIAIAAESLGKRHLIERGFFVPLSEAEVAHLKTLTIPDGPIQEAKATTRNAYEWVFFFLVVYGVYLLSKAGNDAHRKFNSGVIIAGVLGWVIARLRRRARERSDTTVR